MLTKILKKYASTKTTTGLYCSEEILKNLQDIYKNYFARAKSLKIFWTQKILQDVTDELEQDQIIQKQHDANHRGINENKSHISRTYFFPDMKGKITRFINICKLCQRSKYERHPYKQKYKLTEIPF